MSLSDMCLQECVTGKTRIPVEILPLFGQESLYYQPKQCTVREIPQTNTVYCNVWSPQMGPIERPICLLNTTTRTNRPRYSDNTTESPGAMDLRQLCDQVSDRLLNRKNTCRFLFKELMVQTKSELPYRELTFPTILGKGKSSTQKYV